MDSGLTQRCPVCQEHKGQADYTPSRWGTPGTPCRDCGQKRDEDYRRARGVQPKKVGRQDRKEYMQQWLLDNPDAKRRNDLKKYGLTLEQYEEMHTAHGGVCKICGEAETRVVRGTLCQLHVDHDHITGAVRGLLCSKCNSALGYARDDISILKNMIAYLEEQNG